MSSLSGTACSKLAREIIHLVVTELSQTSLGLLDDIFPPKIQVFTQKVDFLREF